MGQLGGAEYIKAVLAWREADSIIALSPIATARVRSSGRRSALTARISWPAIMARQAGSRRRYLYLVSRPAATSHAT
jgi:hypothetical protein